MLSVLFNLLIIMLAIAGMVAVVFVVMALLLNRRPW